MYVSNIALGYIANYCLLLQIISIPLRVSLQGAKVHSEETQNNQSQLSDDFSVGFWEEWIPKRFECTAYAIIL